VGGARARRRDSREVRVEESECGAVEEAQELAVRREAAIADPIADRRPRPRGHLLAQYLRKLRLPLREKRRKPPVRLQALEVVRALDVGREETENNRRVRYEFWAVR
jgi:hypothetical protein